MNCRSLCVCIARELRGFAYRVALHLIRDHTNGKHTYISVMECLQDEQFTGPIQLAAWNPLRDAVVTVQQQRVTVRRVPLERPRMANVGYELDLEEHADIPEPWTTGNSTFALMVVPVSQVSRTAPANGPAVSCAAWSTDGRYLALGHAAGSVTLHDVEDGARQLACLDAGTWRTGASTTTPILHMAWITFSDGHMARSRASTITQHLPLPDKAPWLVSARDHARPAGDNARKCSESIPLLLVLDAAGWMHVW
jgi:hypothetical protein